jgi:hypothetical protein
MRHAQIGALDDLYSIAQCMRRDAYLTGGVRDAPRAGPTVTHSDVPQATFSQTATARGCTAVPEGSMQVPAGTDEEHFTSSWLSSAP